MSHPFLEEDSFYLVAVQCMASCCTLLAAVVCGKEASFGLLVCFFVVAVEFFLSSGVTELVKMCRENNVSSHCLVWIQI